jgi:nucleoside 2-deoxyribosyltransferase
MASKKPPTLARVVAKREKPSAFISAPFTIDTSPLVHAVEKRGLEAIRINELGAGMRISDLLRQSMGRADYVIAVIGNTPNANVWYELGMASGLGKPVLLLASHDGAIPVAATGLTYLKADADNQKAIEFGLDQLLAAPKASAAVQSAPDRETHAIGAAADRLLAMLENSRETSNVRESQIIDIISMAIKESGVSTLSKESSGDARRIADIAVWSSDFEPWIGNPLIIEVKTTLHGRNAFEKAIKQVSQMVDETRSRCGLLLYVAAKPIVLYGASYDPRVVVMSVEDFIGGLRDAGLGDLLLRTRNEISGARG